jgi:flagellar basal-body rod protein FlgF
MDNAAYISLSRQSATRRQMEVIANNIANVSTPAYKNQRLLFSEFVTKGANDMQRMSFVQDTAVIRETSEGPLTDTKNPLDVAIKGDGYFVVQGQDEPLYTRNGRFHLDEKGRLVNTANLPVLDEGDNPVTIPTGAARIEIGEDGSVSTETGTVGRIQVVQFDDEQTLALISNTMYRSDATPSPTTDVKVLQGMIEESNVQPIIETAKMIEALRSYENSQQMIQSDHERVLKAIDTLTHAS